MPDVFVDIGHKGYRDIGVRSRRGTGAMSGSGARAAWRAVNPVSAAVQRSGNERVHGAPGADGNVVRPSLAGLPIEVFSLVDFSGDFA